VASVAIGHTVRYIHPGTFTGGFSSMPTGRIPLEELKMNRKIY
jgi:hypothetical protein